jgi:hypothetical protein
MENFDTNKEGGNLENLETGGLFRLEMKKVTTYWISSGKMAKEVNIVFQKVGLRW